MKKFLIFFVMFLGISFFTNAQECRIKGSTSGRTIKVLRTTWTKGQEEVKVKVSNDDALGANITVELEITYKAKNCSLTETKTVAFDDFVPAQQPTNLSTYITTTYTKNRNEYEAIEVKVKSIKGTACE